MSFSRTLPLYPAFFTAGHVLCLPATDSPDARALSLRQATVNNTARRSLPLSSTFVYDLDNINIGAPITSKSGVKVDAGVYIVDMEGHSAKDIAAYKAKGKTVICYFSAATMEPFRADAQAFEDACVCGKGYTLNSNNKCSGGTTKMGDWDEYWLDIHSSSCKTNVRSVMTTRSKAAQAKGCDGMDPDNVDSNKAPHGNRQADQAEYLLCGTWLAQTIYAEGMLVDLKNSPDMINSSKYGAQIVNAFDFSVIESCAQYKECAMYDAFLKAGKPQIQVEYQNSIRKCPTLKPGQTLAVYKNEVLSSKDITLFCRNPAA